MPLIEPHLDDGANKVSPPEPRSALFFDGTNWRVARVSATGYLEIDVLTSTLPAGAATEATLASVDAYLGLIAVLWNCLRTVGTDRFMVKGEDQLHSFKETLQALTTTQVSGAGGYIERPGPSAGEVWCVTHIMAVDYTSATTHHEYIKRRDTTDYEFDRKTQAFAAEDRSFHHHLLWLEEGDTIRVTFAGSLADDWCGIEIVGYSMTKET